MGRAFALLLGKELRVEARSREVLLAMGLFALLLVVVFAFAFQLEQDLVQALGPGLVWVTVIFAGHLGLGRVIDREREHGALTGLIHSPAGPFAVFWAKAIAAFLFMLAVEVVLVPVAMILVGLDLAPGGAAPLALGLVLGSFGFATVGTLFAAMLAEARLREVIVPLVVYPVAVPVLIAGVRTAAIAFSGAGADELGSYLTLLGGFDVIYAALAPWVFARVMVD
jgi:heme exporter protein B